MRFSIDDLGGLISNYAPVVDKTYERDAVETNKMISTVAACSQCFQSFLITMNFLLGINSPTILVDSQFDYFCDVNSNKLEILCEKDGTESIGVYNLYIPQYAISNSVLYTTSDLDLRPELSSVIKRIYAESITSNLAKYDKYKLSIKTVNGTLSNIDEDITITLIGWVS